MLRALSNDRDEVRALFPEIGRDMLDAVLDALADAVLLVDAAGRILRANRAAERLLAAADGLALGAGGRLRSASWADDRALETLLARAVATGGQVPSGGALRLERASRKPPLRLLAVPLPRVAAGFPREARAVLVVVDPDETRDLPADRLRALFGLTAAEAALAIELAKGEGLPTVAERLGIARATARTHADRVLAKTGTRRQAELARLLERLAALR